MSHNYNGLFAWNVFENMMKARISSQFRINKIIKGHTKKECLLGYISIKMSLRDSRNASGQ